jgi:hypothetical protein
MLFIGMALALSSCVSTPSPTTSHAIYHEGLLYVEYDSMVWKVEAVDTKGLPAIPGLLMPALVHQSLPSCAIGFRRGGWDANPDWDYEKQDILIGEILYDEWRVYSPEGTLTYISYTPLDSTTGEDLLPAGHDFYIFLGEDAESCLFEVEEVLETFKAMGHG